MADSLTKKEEEDLEKTFLAAANFVRSQPAVANQDNETLLELYGYYKQSTEGPCEGPRPSWYQRVGRAKYDAWFKLGNLSRIDAMNAYLRVVSRIIPEWQTHLSTEEGGKGWVSVSRLVEPEEETQLADDDKTIFDWVKEGNITRVIDLVERRPNLLTATDEDGMTPLHWASDRGNLDMVRTICERFNVDVNVRDGTEQTALHYAASCGHREVAQLLLQLGIDPLAKDLDGVTAAEIAADSEMTQLLAQA